MLVFSDGVSIVECWRADDNDSLNPICTLCLLAEVAHVECPWMITIREGKVIRSGINKYERLVPLMQRIPPVSLIIQPFLYIY